MPGSSTSREVAGQGPITWRQYQRHATNEAVLALKAGVAALLSLPTGSGKSLIAADAVRRAHVAGLRSLVIAPTRELVEQDAAAIRRIAPDGMAVTIACAGLGEIDFTGHVTVGTPQTVARRLELVGPVDLLVIDEAHRLGGAASGQIFSILSVLRERNPALKLLGMTATPFRLDSGLLIEGDDAVFERVVFEAPYAELVRDGYLAPLVGPGAALERMSVEGLRLVAGDYSGADLARLDEFELTSAIAAQIVEHGVARKSWLVFAVSIEHAEHLAAALVARGVDARVLVGSTPAAERAALVNGFKAGGVRCLVGVDVFSTGFDAPHVDLIAIARPTASPVWHVQSAGRGTRVAEGKTNCLVLDFAGNFARLGPIDAPVVRAKGERAAGDEARNARECPNCAGLIGVKAEACPLCGEVLKRKRAVNLADAVADHDTIQGRGVFKVTSVEYAVHRKAGRPDSLRITYRIDGYRYASVWEFLCAWHSGHVGRVAQAEWRRRSFGFFRVPSNASEAARLAPAWLRVPDRIRIGGDGFAIPIFEPMAEAS